MLSILLLIVLFLPLSPQLTEANAAKALAESEALAEEQAMQEWKGGGRAGSQTITRSLKSGNRQMANIGKVKFQPPNVPVIFVLGNTKFHWRDNLY